MKKPNRRSKRTSVTAEQIVTERPPRKEEKGEEEEEEEEENRRRIVDLEKENLALKKEIAELKKKACGVSPETPNGFRKLKEGNPLNLPDLQEQVTNLKKKIDEQYQLSMQKIKSSEARKGPEAEIQRLKAQKVQLLCKMKLESVQFRLSRASLEKEVLQLKKEQRRYKYEMRNLLALNERQKLVLQRKTEEASMATKRMYELLESRKNSSQKPTGANRDSCPGTQGIEFELKLSARVEEIRSDYERQMEEMAEEVRKYEEEAENLREENFRFMLQDKEIDCIARDSELQDLKHEVARLSNLVGQMAVQKRQEVPVSRQRVSSISTGSDIVMKMDKSESCGGSVSGMVNATSRVCCSCSKKSLCKTTKCECRDAGGSCGSDCGCSTSKCTNRKMLPSKVNESEPGESQNLVKCSGSPESENSVLTFVSSEMENACEPIRKPLGEIGNILNNPTLVKPDKKTRKKKSALQIDGIDSEGAEGLRKTEEAVVGRPRKVTRATRASALEGNL